MITFDPDEFGDEVHVVTVDCVNFIVQEPRSDPSTKWFDQKSHSAGMIGCLIIIVISHRFF